MEYVLLFLLFFNSGVVAYTAWQIINYMRWKRAWRQNKDV